MILLCCLDFSGRHIVPQVAVKSSCAQPAQKGRYLVKLNSKTKFIFHPTVNTYDIRKYKVSLEGVRVVYKS